MGIGKVMNSVCFHLRNVPMKVLCIMLVGLQAFFLDMIIIHCYGDGKAVKTCMACLYCYWWICGDVAVVILFILTFVFSHKHVQYLIKYKGINPFYKKYGFPLSCVTWFIYSLYVSARVIFIFKTGIDDMLDEKDFYGPQFLKTGIALTAVVFILFTASHHQPGESESDRLYINSLATGVTFDILDTVDFLDILFVKETHVILPYALENGVIAISVINLIRPTFSFVVWVLNHFALTKISRELKTVNTFIYVFVLNLPFLIIRMFLWHNLSQDMSVFLIKNFIMIFIGVHEIYEINKERQQEDGNTGEVIEMGPSRLTLPHRPSDLVDGANPEEQSEPPANSKLINEEATNEEMQDTRI